ncbi:MAG: hypothetical protein ACJ8G1_20940 [Vitreoscilla sp.]
MHITAEQFEYLRRAHLEGFLERLRRHLERTFEARCAQLAPGVLDRSLRDSVDRAAQFDIRSERGIAKFVETAYWLFWHPERHDLAEWAHRMLASEDLDPMAKMEHVYRTVREALMPAADARTQEAAA